MFDENRLTRDDFLGRVELPLVSLPREAEGRSIPNKYYILQPRSARSKVGLRVLRLEIIPFCLSS